MTDGVQKLIRETASTTDLAPLVAAKLGLGDASLGLVTALSMAYQRAGVSIPRPFDGRDGSSEIAILLGQALFLSTKTIMELQIESDESPGGKVKLALALSSMRELDLQIRIATQKILEIEAMLYGARI